jgi:hypothetical protein
MSIDERIAEICGMPFHNSEFCACNRIRAALANPVLRGEIENAAYERAAEICDTWSGYKTYQGDAQGACDDCAAAIRALKK